MTQAAELVRDELSVAHATFTIERNYPHAPEKVFHALSDQPTKRRWQVEGEGWEVYAHDMDFRVGGSEVARFSYQGGPEMLCDTQYHDIVANRRLVFAYRMEMGGKPLSGSLTTIELFPKDGGTLLTYTEQGAYLDGTDDGSGRREGCAGLLEKLAEELATHG